MKSLFQTAILIISFFICFSTSSANLVSIGIVKSVSGVVLLKNGQSTLEAVPNMKLTLEDSIITGKSGFAGLIFEDDTVVSVGPNSEMAITSFLFNPADNELSFAAKFLKGTFSFITGQIAKLAPQNIQLETPDATLGVRGTKFLIKVD